MLNSASIHLDSGQAQKLWAYHNLLRNRNQDGDLTRLFSFESIVERHYIDSMIVGDLWKLLNPILDIGTGAGFPGIPLKIRYPNLKLILAEPRPRRVDFLNDAKKLLRLTDTEVFPHRVVSASYQTPVRMVITRALETMDKTLLRASGCTQAGTQFVFLKGPEVDPELKATMRRFGKSFQLLLDKPYQLLNQNNRRRLIVLECQTPLNFKKDTPEE